MQSVVDKDLPESFVIGDHHEVVAASGKVARPVKAPDHNEDFSFHGCIIQDVGSGKRDSPPQGSSPECQRSNFRIAERGSS